MGLGLFPVVHPRTLATSVLRVNAPLCCPGSLVALAGVEQSRAAACAIGTRRALTHLGPAAEGTRDQITLLSIALGRCRALALHFQRYRQGKFCSHGPLRCTIE